MKTICFLLFYILIILNVTASDEVIILIQEETDSRRLKPLSTSTTVIEETTDLLKDLKIQTEDQPDSNLIVQKYEKISELKKQAKTKDDFLKVYDEYKGVVRALRNDITNTSGKDQSLYARALYNCAFCLRQIEDRFYNDQSEIEKLRLANKASNYLIQALSIENSYPPFLKAVEDSKRRMTKYRYIFDDQNNHLSKSEICITPNIRLILREMNITLNRIELRLVFLSKLREIFPQNHEGITKKLSFLKNMEKVVVGLTIDEIDRRDSYIVNIMNKLKRKNYFQDGKYEISYEAVFNDTTYVLVFN